MWYFPYDMILLPILYAFLLFSPLILILLILINNLISFQNIFGLFVNTWIWIMIFIIIFLLIYSFIPSIQVSSHSESKRIKNFFGTFLLHHTRGFAWGLGLLLGIKDYVLKKR